MKTRFLAAIVASLLTVFLFSGVFAGTTALKKVTTETLGGPDRYLCHIALDKPIYRPGETLYARAVVLSAIEALPLIDAGRLNGTVQVKGPKGDIVSSGYVNGENGSLGYSWTIPEEQAGGEYVMTVTMPWVGFPPAERKFDIRSYRPPRLKTQIVFLRDGYGPGDKAAATMHVERAEGGIPEGAKVSVSARVDGSEVHSSVTKVDREGNVSVSFDLPEKIETGDGTLGLTIEDGGIVETAAKTIPILLQTLDFQMFPEGGDLVEGLPGRVYVESRNRAQKPADVAAEVRDSNGKVVTRFRTEHEGRGRFSFTPRSGAIYIVRITEPAGVKKEFPVPPAKADGVVLAAGKEFIPADGKAEFTVISSKDRKVQFTLSKCEQEFATTEIACKAGKPAAVSLDPGKGFGVLTATVWSDSGTPLAERLVFRQPSRKINVEIKAKEPKHIPGSPVNLTVKTTDEKGKPVSAYVGVTITDDAVLEMVEKREQAPRLPAMVLLESDVRELFDAHVYLDGKNPKSPIALDLLMGTQGWRRFALADAAKFFQEHGDRARRAFALKMATQEEIQTAGMARNALEFDGADRAMLKGARMENIQVVRKAERPGAPPPLMPAAARGPAPAQAAMPPAAPPMNAPMDAVGEDRQAIANGIVANAKRNRELAFEEVSSSIEASAMVWIREYAHKARAGRQPGERTDFTETLYWNGGIKTAPETGEAQVAFELSDAVTTFRVLADAYGDGALGEGSIGVESVEAFSIEPKIPLEVSAGDMIKLPIGVVNNQAEKIPEVTISPKAGEPLEPASVKPLSVGANERVRGILPVYVGSGTANVDLTLDARAGSLQDKVTKKVSVKPRGFPIEIAMGGLLKPNEPFAKTLTVPPNVMSGSLSAKAAIFPTPLANLTEAMESLIREPCGCFEQTSSSNYPLVMAQAYFLSHTGVPAEFIARSKELLDRGYKRLTGFECKDRGYEWFGESPAHEALTAYGLMEFRDMGEVFPVDGAMVDRTRGWLIGTRDGKGGFKRERRALHTWVTDEGCSNGYITWALLCCGEKGLEKEVSWVRENALKSTDSYVKALGANVMLRAGDKETAGKLLQELKKNQAADGSVAGAKTSITQSGGEALLIETTALAVLGWLDIPQFTAEVEKGMLFLSKSCKGGCYGSTQSTVLALKAIVAYDKERSKPKAPGSVRVFVDGSPAGASVSFDDKTKGAIILEDFHKALTPGEHKIELKMTDGSEMPFSMTVSFHSPQPENSSECKVGLTATLPKAEMTEGDITEARVVVKNLTKDTVPMPVAIIGVPGGLEPRHDQLKELVKSKTIAAYEVMGRNIVLYWRELEPQKTVSLNISMTAAVPGTYEGPACRTYLYYTNEHKNWVQGMKADIKPRS